MIDVMSIKSTKISKAEGSHDLSSLAPDLQTAPKLHLIGATEPLGQKCPSGHKICFFPPVGQYIPSEQILGSSRPIDGVVWPTSLASCAKGKGGQYCGSFVSVLFGPVIFTNISHFNRNASSTGNVLTEKTWQTPQNVPLFSTLNLQGHRSRLQTRQPFTRFQLF